MNLSMALPHSIRARMMDAIGPQEEVLYSVKSDLTLAQQFGESYVLVTTGHVAVCDADTDVKVVALKDVEEASVEELFSSSSLTVERKDKSKERLVTFSKACVPEFAALARAG